jgi:hypothetical protein
MHACFHPYISSEGLDSIGVVPLGAEGSSILRFLSTVCMKVFASFRCFSSYFELESSCALFVWFLHIEPIYTPTVSGMKWKWLLPYLSIARAGVIFDLSFFVVAYCNTSGFSVKGYSKARDGTISFPGSGRTAAAC